MDICLQILVDLSRFFHAERETLYPRGCLFIFPYWSREDFGIGHLCQSILSVCLLQCLRNSAYEFLHIIHQHHVWSEDDFDRVCYNRWRRHFKQTSLHNPLTCCICSYAYLNSSVCSHWTWSLSFIGWTLLNRSCDQVCKAQKTNAGQSMDIFVSSG